MNVRRRTLLAAAALATAAASALATTPSHAAPAPPTFATPVVVDHFRPGYEPDVAVDRHGEQHSAYVTWPFGFSTTQSFIERSDDGMASFHLSEGNAIGKDAACVGGGDTEAILNQADGQFFFSDLQGLTNFSNATSKDGGRTFTASCSSVKGAGVDRQWLAVDNNGGSATVGSGGSDARVYFEYDNVAQDSGSNQLVINQSVDGANYGSNLGCSTTTVCPTPATVISGDEGLPGPVVVDNSPTSRFRHSVYVAHNNSNGDGFIVSICRPTDVATATAATTADYCTDVTAFDPTSPARVSTHWHDVFVRASDPDHTVQSFTVVAADTAGNLYASWDEFTAEDGGTVFYSRSVDGGEHWTAPTRVNKPNVGTNIFPWITAGSPGRAAIAWYGADQASENEKFGPDTLDHGTWNVYLAQTLDGLTAKPHFTQVKVSDHVNKFGNISTQGLGGSPDRSLGDYLEVQQGVHGEAIVSYVDDTSADRNKDACGCGQTPPEAAGPVMIARQTGGPSLLATVGTVTGPSDRRFGSATDPSGVGYPDAFLSTATQDTTAPAALDVKSASVKQVDATHLEVRLQVAQRELAGALSVSPTLGGTTGEWMVRWAAPRYDEPGDGNIFYVGMESVAGQPPSFYTGSTASIDTTHAKYFVYPKDATVPGQISDDTIVWTVPLDAIGSPSKGQGLYSVTGFTATKLGPNASTVTTPEGGELTTPDIPNLIDAAPPFTFVLSAGGTGGTGGSGGSGSGSGGSGGSGGGSGSGGGGLPATGLPGAVPVAAVGVAALAAFAARRRRRATR
jgi:uncharacterized membrane protein YgcG